VLSLPADGDLVGEYAEVAAGRDDTLIDVARRRGLGYEEVVNANPGVDPWLPGEGTMVRLPLRRVLPDTTREGIVVNLPEHRLYYYPAAKAGEPRVVVTYPISVGKMDWSTPLGLTRVAAKVKDPAWYPPESVRTEHAKHGDILPKVVPAGPDNPLGAYMMRLAIPGGAYLIHGTNLPAGVGMQVTHGCMRLYPEDIEELFKMVAVETPVRIVNQPQKTGWAAASCTSRCTRRSMRATRASLNRIGRRSRGWSRTRCERAARDWWWSGSAQRARSRKHAASRWR
jgi:L,D-transpeptidase ErfK/SrfK